MSLRTIQLHVHSVIYVLSMEASVIEWESVGGWVGALAGLFGTAVAFWVALRGGRTRKTETLHESFDQATLIAVVPAGTSLAGRATAVALGRWQVENKSVLPYFDLRLEAWLDPNGLQKPDPPNVDRLNPGGHVEIWTPMYDQPSELHIRDPATGVEIMRPVKALALDFSDQYGRRWRLIQRLDGTDRTGTDLYLKRGRNFADKWGVKAPRSLVEHPGPVLKVLSEPDPVSD